MVIHHVPGRVRLRIDRIKHNPNWCNDLYRYVTGLPGVRNVRIKRQTGSVVVEYDDGIFDLSAVYRFFQPAVPNFSNVLRFPLERIGSSVGNRAIPASCVRQGVSSPVQTQIMDTLADQLISKAVEYCLGLVLRKLLK